MNQLPEKVIQHTSTDNKFISEEILIKPIDYYFSNSISRASKTMSDCRQINKKAKKQVKFYVRIYTNFKC